MKTCPQIIFRFLALALFLFFSMTVEAQKSITWKGGAPGMENDWNCYKNWSNHRVPDEFSDVIIPDVTTTSFASPILHDGKVEVNSLTIGPRASLKIQKAAQLVVLSHIAGLTGEQIQVEGNLFIIDGETEKLSLKGIAGEDN